MPGFKRLWIMFSASFVETLTKNVYTTGLYQVIAAVSYYPVLALALAGLCMKASRAREVALIHLLIVSVALAYAAMTVNTRYRLPLDAYLILYASVPLAHLWRWKFQSRVGPAV